VDEHGMGKGSWEGGAEVEVTEGEQGNRGMRRARPAGRRPPPSTPHPHLPLVPPHLSPPTGAQVAAGHVQARRHRGAAGRVGRQVGGGALATTVHRRGGGGGGGRAGLTSFGMERAAVVVGWRGPAARSAWLDWVPEPHHSSHHPPPSQHTPPVHRPAGSSRSWTMCARGRTR
jgi:hypothetical protein